MLASLFGDLGPPKDGGGGPKRPVGQAEAGDGPEAGFASIAIMETVETKVNARGQMVDRHSHDLVVTGSPAQAIRDHFSATRGDLDTATSLITLLDPVGVWASAVIKALSDAGGRPVERLHLREHTTLRTLATIERTTLVRRHDDTLRIYHADVRAPGLENAEIPVALMERSQMTTVIIGPMQPHAIDALLLALHDATSLPTWRCPNLLFMLPPNAVWITNQVNAVRWPARLRVHVLSESMTGASSVWNAMLGIWNSVKTQPGWDAMAEMQPPVIDSVSGSLAEAPAAAGTADYPIKVSDIGEAPPAPRPGFGTASNLSTSATATLPRGTRAVLDPARAKQALGTMLTLDGLLGCAVVDSTTGLVLAREVREDQPVDMELAAAACAQMLRAHRQAARNMGLAEHIDEVMVSAGARQQVMRTVTRHPDLFLVALLDKQRTNLALARFQLMEVERGLV